MNKPENISLADYQILKDKYKDNLEEALNKLNNGYPIQYLIGNVEFLNTIINVDERVLIPRFETEGLVDKTMKYAKEIFQDKINIIDLGTGSGCIAIALKKNLDSFVTAIDISKDALKLANINANQNNVDINFIERSMLDELTQSYDIIISNPPYIPKDGFVEDIVKNNEPNIALFTEDNGIYFYKEIIKRHLEKLNNPGLMAFEIGDNEEDLLKEFLRDYPNIKYKFEKDLQGLTRYLFIFNE